MTSRSTSSSSSTPSTTTSPRLTFRTSSSRRSAWPGAASPTRTWTLRLPPLPRRRRAAAAATTTTAPRTTTACTACRRTRASTTAPSCRSSASTRRASSAATAASRPATTSRRRRSRATTRRQLQRCGACSPDPRWAPRRRPSRQRCERFRRRHRLPCRRSSSPRSTRSRGPRCATACAKRSSSVVRRCVSLPLRPRSSSSEELELWVEPHH